MDVSATLGVVGLAIAIPSAIGAALALIRASYNKARLEESDKDNVRLRARADDLEEEVAELKSKLAVEEARVELLQEMVTQRADLENHHIMVMQNYDAMSLILGQMLTVMKDVQTHVTPK